MKKSSKFVRLLAAAAMVVVGTLSASAVDLTLTIAGNEGNTYTLTGKVEYQETGATYPNFYVHYPNKNTDEGGNQVVARAELAVTVTGPNNYSKQFTCVSTPDPAQGGKVENSHTYFGQGIITEAGDYSMDIAVTFVYVDSSKESTVENFTATYSIPGVDLSSQSKITYELAPTEDGCDFNYNITLGKYDDGTLITADKVTNVKIELANDQGMDSFFNEEGSTALNGTIQAKFTTKTFKVWLKGVITVKNQNDEGVTNINLQPYDTPFDLTHGTYDLTYSLGVENFKSTNTTGGTLPYVITAKGQHLDKVSKWKVWAARPDDQLMDVKEVDPSEFTVEDGEDGAKVLRYTHTLTVLPESSNTQIWPKVQAIYKNGAEGDIAETSAYADTTNPTPTGISDVTVAADAEAAYFNLQGVRVAEPVAGQIYIVVKDGKATKAVVR